MRLKPWAALVALAGCATPPQPVADTTPQNPTAVFETRVASSGIAGMFPFETTEKHYVRRDRRREEHAGKGTGTFSGFLMTRLMGHGDTTIERLDRKVRWTLDPEKKQYTECPVHGCPGPARSGETPDEPQRQAPPRQKTEEGCVMRVASSRFDVKPTGQKQTLNGFDTEQYKMAWVVRLRDRERRTTTSTLNVEVWTAPVNEQMREALATESAFDKAFVASLPHRRAAHAEARVVPADVVRSMTLYLGSLSARDRATLQRAANELNKVKGQPIQTKIEWLLEGNACGAKDGPPPQAGNGNALAGLTDLFGAKKEEKPGVQPILSLMIEVQQLGVVPVHDSVFNVPAGYQLMKQ